MIILVAEDTDDIRLMIKIMLEDKGHCVVEAADGREAVELATRVRPDVILMDLSMPVMDGIEAISCLRGRPETSKMPIIAVTAHCTDPAWRRRAIAAGCLECVGKPVDFKRLNQLITRVVSPPSPPRQ
jgi:two-component system cell cycle response regulator DivK